MTTETPATFTMTFDGKTIELPSGGSLEANVEIFEQYKRDNGLQQPRDKYHKVRQARKQAYIFAELAVSLFNSHLTEAFTDDDGANEFLNYCIPTVVNAAFATELYLKSLLEFEGKVPWIHELLDLFKALPVHDQDAIRLAATPFMLKHHMAASTDVVDLLKISNKAFEDVRYIHQEKKAPQFKNLPYREVMVLLESVREVCEKKVSVLN